MEDAISFTIIIPNTCQQHAHSCMRSHFSCVQLFLTLWTRPCQAPLPKEFSRQEYWSGLSRPPPGDLPNPGIEPTSLTSPALADRFFTTSATWEALISLYLLELVCTANDRGTSLMVQWLRLHFYCRGTHMPHGTVKRTNKNSLLF